MGIWLLLAVLAGCGREEAPTRLQEPGQAPDQILRDFTTTQSDSGRLQWTFKAVEAHVFLQHKEIQARDIQVDTFGEDGSLNSVLTADSGLIDRRGGLMTAKGNVRVVGRDDYVLRTGVLHYDSKRDLFYTEAFVEVTSGRNRLTGYDMECDGSLRRMLIRREPQSVIVHRGEATLD